MRSFVLMIATAIAGLAFVTDDVRAKDFKLTEKDVKQTCGSSLQSAGGAFGCTKCGKQGKCRDYSCNSSGIGRQGCWRVNVGKRLASGTEGKDSIGTSGIKTKGGSAPSKGRSPAKSVGVPAKSLGVKVKP